MQWAFSEASKAYTRAREKNVLTKIGFLAMEVTTKVAVFSSKMAYSPIPQFVKEKIQEQVEIADCLACCGLEVITRKYPIITQGPETHGILTGESRPVKESKPKVTVLDEREDENPSNFIGTMAYVPVQMTRAGFSGVRYVWSTTISTTGAVLSLIPLVRSDQQSVNSDDSLALGPAAIEYPDRGLIDTPASTSTDEDTNASCDGFSNWTSIPFMGVCICCCACVCLSVSVCSFMCLTTLLCGGVCHCLFMGLWFYYRSSN